MHLISSAVDGVDAQADLSLHLDIGMFLSCFWQNWKDSFQIVLSFKMESTIISARNGHALDAIEFGDEQEALLIKHFILAS